MREVGVILTSGFFDGVHLGHRHLLDTVVSLARERGGEAIAVTFWPHPRTVLRQDARELRLLSTLEEKKALILESGIRRVEVLPFTTDFARLTASAYLEFLRDKYGADCVVMGYDNRIGSDLATASGLKGAVPGLEVVQAGELPVEVFPGGRISSTVIRKALERGEVEQAAAMLGYHYRLDGVVVAGNRMGRTLGFPTANMRLYEPLKMLPGNGVYAVRVKVEGAYYSGMCNIGVRPTVEGHTRTVETHILDFDREIYGLPIGLEFLYRVRDERRFPTLEELRLQLEADKAFIQARG